MLAVLTSFKDISDNLGTICFLGLAALQGIVVIIVNALNKRAAQRRESEDGAFVFDENDQMAIKGFEPAAETEPQAAEEAPKASSALDDAAQISIEDIVNETQAETETAASAAEAEPLDEAQEPEPVIEPLEEEPAYEGEPQEEKPFNFEQAQYDGQFNREYADFRAQTRTDAGNAPRTGTATAEQRPAGAAAGRRFRRVINSSNNSSRTAAITIISSRRPTPTDRATHSSSRKITACPISAAPCPICPTRSSTA